MTEYELYHWGVLGMHWGIRKAQYSPVSNSRNYKIYGDGRIEIAAGQQMQRLVSSEAFVDKNKNSRNIMSQPLKDYSYMSFTPTDNSQYIVTMNPKNRGIDVKRDTILQLTAKNNLKSPSTTEAQQIVVDIIKKRSKELSDYVDLPSNKKNAMAYNALSKQTLSMKAMIDQISIGEYSEWHRTTEAMDKEIQTYVDHEGDAKYSPWRHPEKYPEVLYAGVNRQIANSSDVTTKAFMDEFLETVKSKGYNMLRDENDVGIWSSPVVVLNPEKNVTVTLSEKISKQTVKEATKYIKQAKVDWKALGLDENDVSEVIKSFN